MINFQALKSVSKTQPKVITPTTKTIPFDEFINDVDLDDSTVTKALEECIEKHGNGEIVTVTPTKGANAGIEVQRVVYTDDSYFTITTTLWEELDLDNHYLEPVKGGNDVYLFKYEGTSGSYDHLFGKATKVSKHTGLASMVNKKFKLVVDEVATQQMKDSGIDNFVEAYKVVTLD